MNFQLLIDNYLSELKKELEASKSGEATAELSFRTSLDNLFKGIASHLDGQIVTIPEPKNQNKVGRPDWRFHNSESMGIYGYAEAKGLDSNEKLDVNAYQNQIDNYLSLGNPVILTDGIEFYLFTNEKDVMSFSLLEKPINWSSPNANYDIETIFQIFFQKTGYRVISENQLVNEVAKRARLLTGEVENFLKLEEDEAESSSELKTILLLQELRDSAKKGHDKTLEDESMFASFISQVLTFGLLYAHRIIDQKVKSPIDKYDRIHKFWSSVLDEKYTVKLQPFRSLVKGLETELNSDLSKLGLWYDDLRRLLAHVKLTNKQRELPDFHELYEIFLSKYDPNTRFDYGAFYTPRILAFFTVNFAKKVVEESFPQVDLKAPRNKLIDPCCGTGTFIEAILKTIQPHINSEIIGFEILPAPYALAHYRMSIISDDYPENVQIKLINTLSDNLFKVNEVPDGEDDLTNILVKEQQEAYKLSTPPLTLIIGNPPSSDSKFQVDNEGEKIKNLIEDFRPDQKDRISRQNTQKQISNEFVKFLRWSVNRALNSSPSIFVLILPSSFAKHPSYKFARKFLVENFQELWVLDFDSDLRTGGGNVNIFNTKQGRLILAGIYKEDRKSLKASVKYHSIAELKRNEKENYFKQEVKLEDWQELEVENEDYSLKPRMDFNKKVYNSFWPITGSKENYIFSRHCSGLKLAPSHLLIHSSKGQLTRRGRYIADNANNYNDIKKRWYSGQRKIPSEKKITDSIRKNLQKAIQSKVSISKYSYRPFVETSVILNDHLLSELQKLGGGGTRDRPEIRAAYQDSKVFGFIVSPAPEDIGTDLHKFSSFCWNIPDNDLSKRGSARIFCNYFPEYKKKGEWNAVPQVNINPKLIQLLNRKFNIKSEELIDHITYYTYAILSSKYYLEAFKGALYGVSGKWPRIPITASKDLFLTISSYGRKLAEIEKQNYLLRDIQVEDKELKYYKYSLGKNKIELKDENNKVLKSIEKLDPSILNFEVSGYKVISEWLKLHSYPYYRKSLQKNELIELKTLINKINKYLKEIEYLDEEVKSVLKTEIICS